MNYQDELRAMSSLVRAWEVSHDKALGDLSLRRLGTEDRRHARMLRTIRAASGDGTKHIQKRRT